MAFSDPATSPWQRASVLNEIVTATNARSKALWPSGGDQLSSVEAGDIIQRWTFWAGLQNEIEAAAEAIISGTPAPAKWVVAHSGGVLLGASPAYYDNTTVVPTTALPVYTDLSDILEAMGCTGATYQKTGGGYGWRRRTIAGWQEPGQMQEGDIISGHVLEDMQSALKAMIWTVRVAGWIEAPKADGGNGFGEGGTRAEAVTNAIADYTPGEGHVAPKGNALARVYVDGPPWYCWVYRSREKATANDIRDDATKDLYWLANIVRGVPADDWEYDAQDDPVYDRKLKHWSTQADQASGNGGANTYTSPDFLGGENFATSPPNAPVANDQYAGWEAKEAAVAIDWRDWFTHYE